MIFNKEQFTYHCELCGHFIISYELYQSMVRGEVTPVWRTPEDEAEKGYTMYHICKHCGTPVTWHEVNEQALETRKYGFTFDRITGEKIDVRDQKEFEFKF